jgi:predicted nucleotide-binding protein (sugar kinase/HSP70/actin superfamily)
MRVTFPHMGTLHLTLDTLFRRLGTEIISPPPTTKETLAIGMQYSPEFACLPLKLMLGNFIQAVEQGADAIIMCGGCGPCRLGHYAQVQQEILHDLGYHADMIVLEANIGQLLPQIRKLAPSKSWREIYQNIQVAWGKMTAIDEVEHLMHQIRPRAVDPASVTKIYEHGLQLFSHMHTPAEIAKVKEDTAKELREVPVDNRKRLLRVGIVGELFVALEPLVNQEIERHLGNMGVAVERTIYISDWVRGHLFWNHEARRHREAVAQAAGPYLQHWVGGHGLESIGRTIQLARQGYDGVIQVFPFTCMPEIVAKSILPRVSEDYNIPVMTLVLDEHAGEAGIMTRLEAFIDLMARRRNQEELYHECILGR